MSNGLKTGAGKAHKTGAGKIAGAEVERYLQLELGKCSSSYLKTLGKQRLSNGLKLGLGKQRFRNSYPKEPGKQRLSNSYLTTGAGKIAGAEVEQ